MCHDQPVSHVTEFAGDHVLGYAQAGAATLCKDRFNPMLLLLLVLCLLLLLMLRLMSVLVLSHAYQVSQAILS